MKNEIKYFSLPIVMGIWIIAMLVNFNAMIMGNRVKPQNVIATFLFLIAFSLICFFPMGRKLRIFFLGFTAVMFSIAIIGCVVALSRVEVGFMHVAILLLIPFYGLRVIFGNHWAFFYSSMIAINAIWIVINLWTYMHKDRK